MDYTSMDPQTTKVAIQLQLADIADSIDSLYEIQEPAQGDDRASLETIQRDLIQQLALLEGQVLVIKILKDEYDQRVAFKRLLDDEKQAVNDHKLALELAGMSTSAANAACSADYEAQLSQADDDDNDTQWEMAKQLYACASDDNDLHPALEGGSVQPVVAKRAPLHGARTVAAKQAQKQVLGSKDLIKCNACMEIVPTKTTLRLQCAHTYCRTCLLDLFTSAISNPTLFPPRCCKLPFPLETCRVILPKELIKEFDLKVEELATPNPTYCANSDCSKFIRPKDIKSDAGSCVFCKSKTCVQCKNQSHNGLCPSDPHVQLLMDAAKRSKWQQCTKCKNMVELAQGCFHMTCRCKHQFCYLCGMQWKRCSCPQWQEDYLTRPTPVAAAPAAPAAVLAPQPAPHQATTTAVHEHSWQRHNGGTCQGCGADWLPWVMRCGGCGFASCWRCIHNRD